MNFTFIALALALATASNAAVDKGQNKADKDVLTVCVGILGATPFIRPGATTASCCVAPAKVTWFNEAKQIGECCSSGQSWSEDKSSGLGACCASGLHFKGDKASNTGGCCAPGLTWLNGACAAKPPARPTCKALAEPVCASDHDLGIKYGHCYILKFTDGTQLGADHDVNSYSKNGFFRDIPFKVCKSTTDCSVGDAVPTDGSWYLQDQVGRPRDAAGTLGWIDHGFNGTHIRYDVNPAIAGVFKGVPYCSEGKCFLKLGGGPQGTYGFGATCPIETHGLSFYPNRKMSIPMSFTETACSGPDAPFVPIVTAAPTSPASSTLVSSLVTSATGKVVPRAIGRF
ncbi:hypothetical protein ONZ45_g17059 [Pleurotus djamor]|nr:hypothetical protein ONZ45_g17059 [Pleurotus djamor]